MSATLSAIWRHPIKSVGRESLGQVPLDAGGWLPVDRLWAVEHAGAKAADGWRAKANFLRTVTAPALMAVTARWNDPHLTLEHPARGQITLDPEAPNSAAFIDWIAPLWPEDQPPPLRIVRAREAHLTDVPNPWVSVHTTASHRAVEARAGRPLSHHRWRGNLWVDGTSAWQEFDWIGRDLRIGAVTLRVHRRISRCKATMANPESGERDVDTLDLLRRGGDQDFGVYAEVLSGGTISLGDRVEGA